MITSQAIVLPVRVARENAWVEREDMMGSGCQIPIKAVFSSDSAPRFSAADPLDRVADEQPAAQISK